MQQAKFASFLVGIDASDQTEGVLQHARILSESLGAQIAICTVANVPTSVQGNEKDGFPGTKEEQSLLDRIKEMVHSEFRNNSETIDVKILHGDPAERITEYAEYLDCDLVIVGSRGQGALKKALLGSVSSSVANRCKRSVLIVR